MGVISLDHLPKVWD